MEQIRSMQRLSPLITAQLRPGVRTNCALTPEDYRREMDGGTLYVHPLEAGLLLLRRRSGHWILNGWFSPGQEEISLPVDEPVTAELPFRPKDGAEAEGALSALFTAGGFVPRLRRVRLTRPAGPAPEGAAGGFVLRPAEEADLPAVQKLLEGCFDPLTGCLPDGAALADAAAAGDLLCALDGCGGPAGVLHSRRTEKEGEIRHLAVRPELRGRGCARGLLTGWLARLEGRRARVWTGADNLAALRTYGGAGFREDGWRSLVLVRPGQTTTDGKGE